MEETPQKVWKIAKARKGGNGNPPPLHPRCFSGTHISKGEILPAGLCRESRSDGEGRATPLEAGWLHLGSMTVLGLLPPSLRISGGEALGIFENPLIPAT
jgi:hypothetical protein